MGFRPLQLVRPFLSVLPDVQTAERRVSFREKVNLCSRGMTPRDAGCVDHCSSLIELAVKS